MTDALRRGPPSEIGARTALLVVDAQQGLSRKSMPVYRAEERLAARLIQEGYRSLSAGTVQLRTAREVEFQARNHGLISPASGICAILG